MPSASVTEEKGLSALADSDHAFLRRVWLRDLDHRNGVFLRGVVGGHIKIDWLTVQRVAAGGRKPPPANSPCHIPAFRV